MRFNLVAVLLILSFSDLNAQFPQHYGSSELLHELKKFDCTASVLYMAAHPDDENTRLISYFENELHARVAYLSLTRGDGGQNLIGTEIGAGIGVLRTQELLKARSIDGGEQFFTRAVDFGYSKSADETLEKWGRDMVLADVVWVIRKFRPDVIVTRFPPTNYAGHGHHQASAMLAEEAFELAADPNAYPDQLDHLDVWQPKRLYFNTSTWWIKDLEDQAKSSDDFLTIDVGQQNYLLGETYGQIAARSRSMHRSQGFGSDYPYGTQVEYVKYVKGDKADRTEGILAGLDQGWAKYGLESLNGEIEGIISDYNPEKPFLTALSLTEIAKQIGEKPKLAYKKQEIDELISRLSGLSISLFTDNQYAVRGSEVLARLVINNASELEISLKGVSGNGITADYARELKTNDVFSEELNIKVDADEPYSTPYWLRNRYKDLFKVDDYNLLGTPENRPAINLKVTFELNGYTFEKDAPLVKKEVDPAEALLFDPVYVVPQIATSFSENAVISAGMKASTTYLRVTNYGEGFSGTVNLILPEGWSSNPKSQEISLSGYGDDIKLEFNISRKTGAAPGIGRISLSDSKSGLTFEGLSLEEIRYPHIPSQILINPTELKLRSIEIDRGGIDLIGYIEGPGDEVATYLRAAGYEVEVISGEALKSAKALAKYDAIVTGIRAYNTREDLRFANPILNTYVENGGTWLVQYNTSRRIKSEEIGPYDFTISRERVTDENATASFLDPNHAVFNVPNKLGPADFDNWVQERGLYFASEWSEEFTPLIAWSDEGEPSRDGGLIVANYGKGTFVYSGISFFRELPAGVPGAYRLLANILNLSNSSDE